MPQTQHTLSGIPNILFQKQTLPLALKASISKDMNKQELLVVII
jgi:hypothetical protein